MKTFLIKRFSENVFFRKTSPHCCDLLVVLQSREFPDLIEELSKLVTPASHQNGQASAAKKVSSATSQTVPSGGGSRNHKQATVSASNATAIPDNNGVNMEWLAGTNSLAAVKKVGITLGNGM